MGQGQIQKGADKGKSVKHAPKPLVRDTMPLKTPISQTSIPPDLLDHYASSIARIMVWVDSEQNEYRRVVVPLAKTQEALRLAILAIAAAHSSDVPWPEMGISQAASETALSMITERIRTMAGGGFVGDRDEHEVFIAAALILSNYALLGSQISLAWTHLNAVRILIRTATLTGTSNENLFGFLKNQAATYDVLACTAIFDSVQIKGAILPEFQRDIMFGRFLKVLHDITTSSLPGEAVNRDSAPATTLNELENQFEMARASTLFAVGSSGNLFPSQGIKDDFVRMVQAFHHAGVLYACLRLEGCGDSESEKYHSSRLFHTFDSFEDFGASAHSLAWPVFIAGICCWPNVERMNTVTRFSTAMVEATRFEHYNHILQFHQELWGSQHHDWTTLARDWERRGIPVIPV